jgi:hypothetical protein
MTKEENKRIKMSVSKIKDGFRMMVTKASTLVTSFGCKACAWRDTDMCPHGLVYPQEHSNRICSQRAKYIQSIFNVAGSKTRLLQVDEAVRLRLLLDKLTHDFSEEGLLDPNLAKLSKNIIILLDKMRKQDEGLKIQGDFTVAHEDFRKLVDTEAKKIEEQNSRTRQAEFTEEVRPSNE